MKVFEIVMMLTNTKQTIEPVKPEREKETIGCSWCGPYGCYGDCPYVYDNDPEPLAIPMADPKSRGRRGRQQPPPGEFIQPKRRTPKKLCACGFRTDRSNTICRICQRADRAGCYDDWLTQASVRTLLMARHDRRRYFDQMVTKPRRRGKGARRKHREKARKIRQEIGTIESLPRDVFLIILREFLLTNGIKPCMVIGCKNIHATKNERCSICHTREHSKTPTGWEYDLSYDANSYTDDSYNAYDDYSYNAYDDYRYNAYDDYRYNAYDDYSSEMGY